MLVLTHDDLINAGCFDVPLAIDVVETTLKKIATPNQILFPDKVSQIFDESTQNRINCLPATLIYDKVCGMKWVAVFPENPQKYGKPNLNATILLSEIESGYPIAFMDGTLCSDLRTAAISAVAAKYFARTDSETIGFIGSGEQAKMHFLTIKNQFPQIKRCKIASRNSKSEQRFIEQMSKLHSDMEYIACDSNYEEATREADIVVTAISAQKPILQAEWLSDGVFYSHVGGWEDDYAVPLSMDKIVCDDWESVKHRTQTISRLYKMGKLEDKDIYADLYEVVSGKKRGRETNIEKIYFNAVGLSYVDVALAYAFYNKVKKSDVFSMDILEESIFNKMQSNINL